MSKMMKPSTTAEDPDKALEDFFNDIEKLQISSDEDHLADIGDTAESKKHTKPSIDPVSSDDPLPPPNDTSPAHVSKCSQKNAKRGTIINRAETRKQSWQEFSVSRQASTSSTDEDSGRPKVSFEIRSKRRAKTKKKSASKDNAPLPPPCFAKPQWIAILDTCAVLESYDAVCDLISTAVRRCTALEPITVVIPYKLWSELDYQSKKVDDEGQRLRARRAIRMLNENINMYGANGQNVGAQVMDDSVILCQSRNEMDKAASIFLTRSVSEANNDDHILFCARAEQRLLAESVAHDAAAGGVVLLTWDKVLSGKARADHVQVFTPPAFVEYYKRREASIQSRTGQDNINVALQRACYRGAEC